MANVLLTWELGAGAGHCVNLAPVARHLCEQGHRVSIALRDVCLARKVFGELDVTLLQAPFKLGRPSENIGEPRTFAHILHNTGFADDEELRSLTDAWRNLFHAVQPDLIVFEHSPSALLASRAIDVRRAVLGTGFFSPPDVYPLPELRTWLPPAPDKLRTDEDRVLERINRILVSWQEPPLDRVAQLYAGVDENFLLTFRELDHYQQRNESEYWGMWPLPGGAAPDWPEGEGPCVFGYLRPFRALPNLLTLLAELRIRALLYVVGIDPKLRLRFANSTLHFVDRRVDISWIAQESDLAILNGNAGTATALLLQGAPSFQIPMQLEQAIFSQRMVELGASLSAPPDRAEQIAARLMRMLNEPKFGQAAQEYAARYAGFDPGDSVRQVAERIDRLAGA